MKQTGESDQTIVLREWESHLQGEGFDGEQREQRNKPRYCKTGEGVQTSLRAIEHKASEQPEYRFRNLYGMIDIEMLMLAWRQLNKKAAAGVDEVKAREYGQNLEANLDDLVERLKRGSYKAKLVRRKHIPKGNGKTRPLGIPTLEDRLLQKAVTMLLEAVYEPTFLDSSFGYRPGRDGKKAVADFRDELQFGDYEYIVEADIKGFFNNLDWDWLVEMLELRIDDRKLIRLIRKWLKAGIREPEGMVINPLTGTPQGGIVSPILANVYLHYALDLWVEKAVKPSMVGSMKYVRYADDFVCAFKNKEDAERFHRNLAGRLGKFNLEVAEEKTRILRFCREDEDNGAQRFDFLGFELYWGESRKGLPNLKRRTSPSRLRRSLKRMDEWIKSRRSTKVDELIKQLNNKLRGYYQHYGVIGNWKSLGAFFFHVNKICFKWLNRRSQKKSMTWPKYGKEFGSKLLTPKISERKCKQKGFRFGTR